MASSKEYLDFILDQLSSLEGISYRAMMGEFILYYKGKIVGGIYDDRLLVKPVKSAVEYFSEVVYELPYEGAKEMILVSEVDNREFLTGLFQAMWDDLPKSKKKSNIFQAKDLINNKIIRLYHGNKDKNMVPDFSFNNSNNDYGKGFYTTPDKELGKEWAYSKYTKGKKGYLFTYEIDITNLEILDLTSLDSMHWIAELLANRHLNINNREALQDTIDEVIKLFKLDTSIYDIIIGYRADDSYFTYARDFVSGLIYRETVENALRLGNLGIQVFIKSQKAFDRLKQIGKSVAVDFKYRDKYIDRDNSAAAQYRISRTDNSTSKIKETILDIIKKRRDELHER